MSASDPTLRELMHAFAERDPDSYQAYSKWWLQLIEETKTPDIKAMLQSMYDEALPAQPRRDL